MSAQRRRVDSEADHICALAEKILNHAHENVWGVDWDWDDEDPIRDTATGVERYRQWQATGEHDFLSLRPGLEPQVALADSILIGLGSLMRYWENYGLKLPQDLVEEATDLMRLYLVIRQEEGGPGMANPDTWVR